MATNTLNRASVFLNGKRLYPNVNVEIDEGVVRVKSTNGAEIAEFSIIEVVKDGMAFDVESGLGDESAPLRLVAQTGCGCSGQNPYTPDPTYSGANPHLAK
jgi:hypothetical protein